MNTLTCLEACLTCSMCSKSVGYCYSRKEDGKWTGDKTECSSAPKVSHCAELSLGMVTAKANNTMLLHSDSLDTPPSLSFCQRVFIHFQAFQKHLESPQKKKYETFGQ